MPGNKVKDGVIYTPDREYGLEQKLERFEMAYSSTFSPQFPAMLEAAAKQTARLAAEKYERLGHHFRSDMPVSVDQSDLQVDVEDFRSLDAEHNLAQDKGNWHTSQDRIAFVVKMWYVVPKVRVDVFEPHELAEPDGFVETLPNEGEIEERL